MAHTYTSNLYHCVFTTIERAHIIPAELESKLWDYIGGIARNNGMKSLRVGGITNHIHVLLGLRADMPISKSMQLIKGGSSKWMNEHPLPGRFAWQEGYGAFSIGVSQLASTIRYIESQKEYHRKQSFEDEYLSFLKKHGIEYDPRYVFD
jgi:putative transposase